MVHLVKLNKRHGRLETAQDLEGHVWPEGLETPAFVHNGLMAILA